MINKFSGRQYFSLIVVSKIVISILSFLVFWQLYYFWFDDTL